ncbi:unnamed protein product [Parascedosporium putredinis]|uniref:Piwi domain-containing protein n=1 Tax=Parascedosporium putredinis TaxID=1442378 RepID=A0A9P1MEI4_9PEZI|nr:unnamed protein product [Parascedosporium putredinis]CAI8004706.1 unnamed protein product [Parascedosporium putredinis]
MADRGGGSDRESEVEAAVLLGAVVAMARLVEVAEAAVTTLAGAVDVVMAKMAVVVDVVIVTMVGAVDVVGTRVAVVDMMVAAVDTTAVVAVMKVGAAAGAGAVLATAVAEVIVVIAVAVGVGLAAAVGPRTFEQKSLPITFPEPDKPTNELENDLLSVEGKMSSLSVSKEIAHRLPYRPVFGTRGVRVKLWANYFNLDLKADRDLYRKLQKNKREKGEAPPLKGAKLAQVVEATVELIKTFNAGVALATELKSKIVTTAKLNLPQNPMLVPITTEGRSRRDMYSVSFEGPRLLDLAGMAKYVKTMQEHDSSFPKFEDVVDGLNIVLGHTARTNRTISVVGSRRFFETGATGGPGSGYDMDEEKTFLVPTVLAICRGYFQSVRLSTGRLLLNTNVTHGVFRVEAEVKDIFRRLNIDRCNSLDDLAVLSRIFTRARVEYRFRGGASDKDLKRQKTMMGILESGRGMQVEGLKIEDTPYPGPSQVMFLTSLPNDVAPTYRTVTQYYKEKYGASLNTNWPLLNVGTPIKPTFVPAEFCRILPAPVKVKLNEMDSQAMIEFACRQPGDNYHSIMNKGQEILQHDAALLKDFGVKVGKGLLTVHGRELSAPTLCYKPGVGGKGPRAAVPKFKPSFGAWNMSGLKFAIPGRPITRWGCVAISIQAPDGEIIRTTNEFRAQVNNNCGLQMDETPTDGLTRVMIRPGDPHAQGKINTALARLAEERRVGDVDLGIHTVCMDWKKASKDKGRAGYFGNIALKWNLKMGGVNHQLVDTIGLVQNGKTMVVGYDVVHPTNVATAEEAAAPSVVGLVASIDKELGQWPATAWVHTSRQEVCEDEQLKGAIESRLDLWKAKNNGQLPENIVIYRDGVQEPPRLALIVSVKRHHTRFYPTSAEHTSRTGNIRPGTVVDRGVTQARYWDFFLTAHDSIKGTARPAHYTVLLDEIFTPDPEETRQTTWRR